MSTPPPVNRQIIKIDDDKFYEVMTTSTQHDVNAIARRLEVLCLDAIQIGDDLRTAAAAGVAKASPLVTLMNTVDAFSNKQKSGQFLAALRAILSA